MLILKNKKINFFYRTALKLWLVYVLVCPKTDDANGVYYIKIILKGFDDNWQMKYQHNKRIILLIYFPQTSTSLEVTICISLTNSH